jgi:hypothetical protein
MMGTSLTGMSVPAQNALMAVPNATMVKVAVFAKPNMHCQLIGQLVTNALNTAVIAMDKANVNTVIISIT